MPPVAHPVLWLHRPSPDHRSLPSPDHPTDYTATKPDVFWVTMSQLIEWMSDPKPVSEMGKEMCARPKAPAPTPALPSSGANVTLSLLGEPSCWSMHEAAALGVA